MQAIQAIWRRIETWLAHTAPDRLSQLHPGATEAEIRQAERLMHVKLPKEVRASYRLHNGSDGPCIEELWLFPLSGMVSHWQAMQRIRQDLLERDEEYAEEESDLLDQWKLVQRQRRHPPLEEAGDEAELTGPPSFLYPGWWHPKWVPLLNVGNGNLLCIDLAPGPAGWDAQLLYFWHESGPNHVVASSWSNYLAAFAEDLEAGNYTYTSGKLQPVDERTHQRRWLHVD